MTSKSRHPDVLDELEFLAKAAEIIFSFSEQQYRLSQMEKREKLAAAEREASLWEKRRQDQIAKCADAAACTDLRCRRSKTCRALRWISAKAQGARARLAAEQARWPAPETTANPAPRALKHRP